MLWGRRLRWKVVLPEKFLLIRFLSKETNEEGFEKSKSKVALLDHLGHVLLTKQIYRR